MCIETIHRFEGCDHYHTWVDSDNCPKKDCIDPKKDSESHAGKCPGCIGDEPKTPLLFYKYCWKSPICNHEYNHMLTDAPRDPAEIEVVLVNSDEPLLCPPCKAKGYDSYLGGTNPPPQSKSIVPREYDNIPRRSISIAPIGSRFSSPAAKPTSRSEPPSHKLDAIQATRRSSSTTPPSTATRSRSSRRSSNSSANDNSTRGAAETTRLSTIAESPSSSRQPDGSSGPTASEYLRRGPPKNVSASAFYDNEDGNDARRNLRSTSPSARSRISTTPATSRRANSSVGNSRAEGSTVSSRVAATTPPSELYDSRTTPITIGSHTIAASQEPDSSGTPSQSSRHLPSRTSGGLSRYPGSASVSSATRPARRSQFHGASRESNASSVASNAPDA